MAPESAPLASVSLPVAGMTCAACARVIERTLTRLPGVDAAAVNYATGRASLRFDPSVIALPRIAEAVHDVGYEVIEAAPGETLGSEEAIDTAQRQIEAASTWRSNASSSSPSPAARPSSCSACRTRSFPA